MRKGFTLIELLIVIAIIAILSVVIVLTLNPAEMLRQARDSSRLSDIDTLNRALVLSRSDLTPPSLGTPGITYLSLVDPMATTTAGSNCVSLGLPTSSYHCAGPNFYRKTDGTGWLPVNFSSYSLGTLLSQLPVDPANNSSTKEYYEYATDGSGWELTAVPESQKYQAQASQFAVGSNLSLVAPNYAYEVPFTVTGNTSIASGTQSNFPMLISSALPQWVYPGNHIQNLCTAPNGGQEPCDLTFSTNPSCAPSLNFETESYASSTGSLIDWVNVPSLSAGTVIYACYGSSAVTTDQSHSSQTWGSNYGGVWHLATVNGGLNANDSTANGNNGTNVGAHGGVQPASAEIDGGGYNETSGTSYIDVGNSVSVRPTHVGTVSAWVNWNTFTGYSNPLGNSSSSGGTKYGGFALWTSNNNGSNGVPNFSISNNTTSTNRTTGSTLNSSTWNYLSGTWDGSNVRLYVNGVLKSTVSQTMDSGYYGDTFLFRPGTAGSGNDYLQGYLDEVRIANTALSASWILTEYNNQSSPSTFYAVGGEVTR